MRVIETCFLVMGILSLASIVIIYIRGPWYRKPIGRFLVALFTSLALVYINPIIRTIQGKQTTVYGLTFTALFGIILAYGVYALLKANKAANVEIDRWE